MHKYLHFSLSIALLFFLVTKLSAQTVNFTIRVTGFKKTSGKMHIAVYNDKNGFLSPNKVYKKIELNVNNSIMKHTISIPTGNYAVALFHDSNSNGICDKNFLGIPLERYGFSNNVRPMLSAPSFISTVVKINQDVQIDIALLR